MKGLILKIAKLCDRATIKSLKFIILEQKKKKKEKIRSIPRILNEQIIIQRYI